MESNASAVRTPLTELEQKLMEIVWKRGAATADEVRKELGPKRVLKDSTVRTLLRRLEVKGYVTHAIRGRTFVYAGVEAPRTLAARAVRQLIDRFCGGSVEDLLIGMIESEIIEGKELRRVAKRVARGKGHPEKGGKQK